MKGVENYFSVIDLKNKKKEEDLRILEKVFGLHIKYNSEKHLNPTKP